MNTSKEKKQPANITPEDAQWYIDELQRLEQFLDVIVALGTMKGFGEKSLPVVIEEYCVTMHPYILLETKDILYHHFVDANKTINSTSIINI